jgi:putative protein-disulfide isomerase
LFAFAIQSFYIIGIYLSILPSYDGCTERRLESLMRKTLYYVFDPLCGWCYGASGMVSAAASADIDLRLLPSGLFSGPGARPMDDAFAAYAWANDQRIEHLTGQPFSELYRTRVLADRQQKFDSGLATLALTAVALTAPDRELDVLGALQQARYVDGRDVTRREVLVDLLAEKGLVEASARLREPDAALIMANDARVAEAQALLRALDARGVPTFVLEHDGRRQALQTSTAYSDPQAFLDQFAAA